MINTFKKSINILRNNTLLMQPLLLYILTVLSIMIFLNGRTLTFYSRLMILITFVLLFVAFCAGWFYIITLAVKSYNEADEKEEVISKSIQNFKKFFEGVGSGFLRLAGTYIIIFLIYSCVIWGLSKLCLHYFGMPEFYNDIIKLENASSQAEKMNIINNIPINNQIVFMKWAMVLYPVSMVLNFFAVLYSGIVSFEEKNILICFWKTIKFFFKNIGVNLAAIVLLQVIYIAINILSVICSMNVIGLFIITMLLTIYLNYYLILVFCLYYDKLQIDSNNGTELVGEN